MYILQLRDEQFNAGKDFLKYKRTLPKESISQEKLCRFPRKVYPQDSGHGFKNLLRIRSKKTSTKSRPTYIGRQFRKGIEFEKHYVCVEGSQQ